MEWKNIYRGLLMGISDLIPGVSGGTIAFILGIYDRFLLAISGIFSRDWRRHLGFLLPLALGMGFAILAFSRVIDYLLENHYEPTQFFFLGLIIGVFPFIAKQADVKSNFDVKHIGVLVLVGGILASMAFIQTNEEAVISSFTAGTYVRLFFSGWLASMAMLLPGISGSFVLLLIGAYSTIISALSDLNLPVIMAVGAGAALGFILSSKAIAYLLLQFPHMTFAIIMGLIAGSVFVVFPGLPNSPLALILCIITFVCGLLVTKFFTATEQKIPGK
ncbi:membrane protein [Bacillus sp. FJAT-27916]|uniref:DUF368 domain-containing protein n=1 Tax=Bacillus sp. FJAT-27916 TaxID=1679169 RepID=UPI000670F0A1|nr:DUF368 domain-containing protein [Bacillus sp. FJAT-27916]KMY46561.1 membrane protein [Bacillus sp. FJAT-27916]